MKFLIAILIGSVSVGQAWAWCEHPQTKIKYDYVGCLSEGLAAVSLSDEQDLNIKYGFVDKDGKWGFIEKTGNIIVPILYDNAHYFSQDKAEVKLNGETFYIDKQGNRLP